MQCPKCGAAFERIASGSKGSVDRCAGCHGLVCDDAALIDLQRHWFHWPKGDISVIDVGSAAEGRRWNAMREVACARCGRPMARIEVPEQPHIELDRCDSCALTFFDSGEMTDLRYRTLADWARDWLHARRNSHR